MSNSITENDPLQLHSLQFKAMGSPCAIHLQGLLANVQPALHAAQAEIFRLEQKYSRYLNDSVTSHINTGACHDAVSIDAETAALLNYAQVCFEQSDGLFDITSGVLRRVWNFKVSELPTQPAIDACLQSVGWNKVRWDGETIQFLVPNMEIDFGGVVKEFTADRIAQLCRDHGIHAGLIELGGDISIVGPKRLKAGDYEPWLIGIRHPQTGEAMASIPLMEGGVATSGSYERFIMVDGKRYCHILNPVTGWPVEGLASVSIVAPQCLVSGSLSTIAMLKGAQAGAWLDDQDATYLLLSDDGEVSGSLSN